VTIRYAEKALTFCEETGDILLQLSAYTKLGWAYFRGRRYTQAYKIMQKGESVLQSHQRKKNKLPLPTGMIGKFNSGYALVQASIGISPDRALGIATDSEPLNGRIALAEFTPTTKWLEAARICCTKGDYKQTQVWLEKRINWETLSPVIPQTERGRIEAINIMTNALLQSPRRDLGKIITTWRVGIEGAKAYKNEIMYQEAVANFEVMKVLYPGEQAVMKLAPLTEHWSKPSERA